MNTPGNVIRLVDFYIKEVSYDLTGKIAARFCVQYNLIPHLGESFWADRETVLETILQGYTVAVLIRGDRWPDILGRQVYSVNVNGKLFLRTDQDQVAADEFLWTG